MSPDDGTVAIPHERPPLLRGHFHTTFRVAAGEGFYCSKIAGSTSQLQVSTVGTNVIPIISDYLHKLLPVQPHSPVHLLYCQPGAEDLQISQRL